jgi:transposase-like protein
MDQRAAVGTSSFTAVCRLFGITRQTGYKWLRGTAW